MTSSTDEPRSTQTRSRTTAESLLETGERLFGTHGINGASTRDIAREAGVHLDSVHYHFGTKNAFVEAIFEGGVSLVAEELDRELSQYGDIGPPTIADLAIALVHSTQAMSAREGLGRNYLAFTAALLGDPRLHVIASRRTTPWTDRLTTVLTPLTPTLSDTEREFRVAIAGFLLVHTLGRSHIHEWLSAHVPQSLDQSPELFSTALAGLLGAPPTSVPAPRRQRGRSITTTRR